MPVLMAFCAAALQHCRWKLWKNHFAFACYSGGVARMCGGQGQEQCMGPEDIAHVFSSQTAHSTSSACRICFCSHRWGTQIWREGGRLTQSISLSKSSCLAWALGAPAEPIVFVSLPWGDSAGTLVPEQFLHKGLLADSGKKLWLDAKQECVFPWGFGVLCFWGHCQKGTSAVGSRRTWRISKRGGCFHERLSGRGGGCSWIFLGPLWHR